MALCSRDHPDEKGSVRNVIRSAYQWRQRLAIHAQVGGHGWQTSGLQYASARQCLWCRCQTCLTLTSEVGTLSSAATARCADVPIERSAATAAAATIVFRIYVSWMFETGVGSQVKGACAMSQ